MFDRVLKAHNGEILSDHCTKKEIIFNKYNFEIKVTPHVP